MEGLDFYAGSFSSVFFYFCIDPGFVEFVSDESFFSEVVEEESSYCLFEFCLEGVDFLVGEFFVEFFCFFEFLYEVVDANKEPADAVCVSKVCGREAVAESSIF